MRFATINKALRTGAWLTSQRLRVYPVLVGLALALAAVGLVATSHGAKDYWERPLGVDFSGIWVAGRAVLAGHPAQPYDNAAHAAAQAAAFGPSESYLPWPYPPYVLALAALLAGLPYLTALAAWEAGTCLLYLAAVLRAARGARLARRDVLVAALAFPAAAINLAHGQNGFLSAALIALGGFSLPHRPLLAGVLLGLLAYKPQFAIVIPVAVVAGGYWRAAVSGTLTVVAMTAATWLAFGPEPWRAFVAGLSFTRHIILEAGGLDSWKLQSVFAAVRLWHGSLALAYAAQGTMTLAVVGSLAMLWHRGVDARLEVAGLAVASLLATPYAVDYDMAVLAPALAALASLGMERGFPPYGKTLIALAWVMPLVARPAAMAVGLPIGVVTMACLYVIVLQQAAADRSARVATAALAG